MKVPTSTGFLLAVLAAALVAGCPSNGNQKSPEPTPAAAPDEPAPAPEPAAEPEPAAPAGEPEPAPATETEPEPAPADEPAAVSLASDLMPLFERSCAGCHRREGGNPAAVADGTYLERAEDILGRVGRSIVAGKPGDSGFLKVLDRSLPVGKDKIVMPPPGAGFPAWSKEELEKISNWIAQGAEAD